MIGSALAFDADDPAGDRNHDQHEQAELEYPCERADQPLNKGDHAENSQRGDHDERRKRQSACTT